MTLRRPHHFPSHFPIFSPWFAPAVARAPGIHSWNPLRMLCGGWASCHSSNAWEPTGEPLRGRRAHQGKGQRDALTYDISTGWWWLVVWNIVALSWEFYHPNWRSHIFQRGRYTTNQYQYIDIYGGFRNHGATPPWMVYYGKSHENGLWLGVALFQETTIWPLVSLVCKYAHIQMCNQVVMIYVRSYSYIS